MVEEEKVKAALIEKQKMTDAAAAPNNYIPSIPVEQKSFVEEALQVLFNIWSSAKHLYFNIDQTGVKSSHSLMATRNSLSWKTAVHIKEN